MGYTAEDIIIAANVLGKSSKEVDINMYKCIKCAFYRLVLKRKGSSHNRTISRKKGITKKGK